MYRAGVIMSSPVARHMPCSWSHSCAFFQLFDVVVCWRDFHGKKTRYHEFQRVAKVLTFVAIATVEPYVAQQLHGYYDDGAVLPLTPGRDLVDFFDDNFQSFPEITTRAPSIPDLSIPQAIGLSLSLFTFLRGSDEEWTSCLRAPICTVTFSPTAGWPETTLTHPNHNDSPLSLRQSEQHYPSRL